MRTMMSLRVSICTIAVLLTLVSWSSAQPVASERLLGDLDMADNDGSVERAFFDYLFAKQLAQRIRNQLDAGDLQRKRSYWKQCAFNAVSCFGK